MYGFPMLRQRRNRGLCRMYCLEHALARSAADNIVAVECSVEINSREEVSLKLFAELFQLSERERVQLYALLKRIAHGIANLFMRLAEGNTLVDEIRGCSHCIEIAVLRSSPHCIVVELECGSKTCHQGQHL